MTMFKWNVCRCGVVLAKIEAPDYEKALAEAKRLEGNRAYASNPRPVTR